MIKVRYNNDASQECVIRPTPFVSINTQTLKNSEGNFGVTYAITLTGTILEDQGTPYALEADGTNNLLPSFDPDNFPPDGGDRIGPYGSFDNIPLSQRPKPPRQKVMKPAASILSKQRSLRALFARDGQTLIITDIIDDQAATVFCNPRVVSINFTEGQYISRSEYTITLEADALYRGYADDENAYIDEEAITVRGVNQHGQNVRISDLLEEEETSFIKDFNESWNLEVDDGQGESLENPRSYRISHTISANGKAFYGIDGEMVRPAWEQAKNFVQQRLSSGGSEINYPNVAGQIGSGTVNLVASYGGYNQVRTEQIDVGQGTYSVTENWLLSSGTSTEKYNMSTSSSTSNAFVDVKIDGSIKGMSQITPSGFGDPNEAANKGAYKNALDKYNRISNSGLFGLSSDLYRRANNLVAVQLNSQPTSISIGTNQFAGEITYSLGFNNRPTNIISGVLSENITINDTYPGDVFASIPVIGRQTGPVLQYLGGRTEYKRDISLSLTMDYTKVPYGSGRHPLIMKKPSLVEPTSSQIADLLEQLSPMNEPGVRKYFVSPPTENWNPKTGSYNFNVSFTYELDK